MVSLTTFQRDFDYISVMYQFCQQKKLDSSEILKEITDPNDRKTKNTFVYQLDLIYSDLLVHSTGSGASKKKAKAEACKSALVQLIYYLRLTNPVIDLEDYGLSENDLSDYEQSLAENQLNVKASPFLPTTSFNPSASDFVPSNRAEKPAAAKVKSDKWTPSPSSVSLNWRDDQKTVNVEKSGVVEKSDTNDKSSLVEKTSAIEKFDTAEKSNTIDRANTVSKCDSLDKQVAVEKIPATSKADSIAESTPVRFFGYFAKAPDGNGFQKARGNEESNLNNPQTNGHSPAVESSSKQESTFDIQKFQRKIDKIDLNETVIEAKLKNVAGDQQNPENKLEADWEIAEEAVGYLKENQDIFAELLELHEKDTTMSYAALIHRLIKLMPQRKLKYEFRSSDQKELGISRLLYLKKNLNECIQTVFAPARPPVDLEESCAKKMIYVLKLNYLS